MFLSEEGLTAAALMFHVVVHYMHDAGFSPLLYIYIYIYIYIDTHMVSIKEFRQWFSCLHMG